MLEDESRKTGFPLFARFGTLIVLWLLTSWFIADSVLKSHTREHIQDETVALDKLLSSTAQSIDMGLDYLHGIPTLVAQDELIPAVMSHYGSAVPSSIPVEKRKKVWSRNPLLKNVDSHLQQVQSTLGADAVWITNAAGDLCRP
jgi:C4-dicarboxylate-specific signal transduction histidine kinase